MTDETGTDKRTGAQTGAEVGAPIRGAGPAVAQTHLDQSRRGRRNPENGSERLIQLAEAIERGIKFVPDRTANETHYSRSLRIRISIGMCLLESENTVWASYRKLRATISFEARCNVETVDRWLETLTLAVGAPWEIVEPDGGVTGYIVRRAQGWMDVDIVKFLKNFTPRR